MRGSRLHGNDGATAPTSVQGASTQGCEVPVFTGTTGRPPLHPYRGHPHRDARFPSSRERRGRSPLTLIPFSPQGRRDLTSAQGGTLTLTLSQRERGFPRLRGERRGWFAKTTYAANVMAGAAAQWGSCRLDWRYVGGGVAFGRFANRPYIRTGGIHTGMRGSRLHGNDGLKRRMRPTSVHGWRIHTWMRGSRLHGNDGGDRLRAVHPHPSPFIPSGGIHTGMRGSRLHGNDGATAPVHPHPNLLPSREKGPDIHTGGHPHPNPLPEGEGIPPPARERRGAFERGAVFLLDL